MFNILSPAFIKYSLYFLNLLFASIGIGLIILGTRVYSDGNRYIALLPETILNWAVFFIVTGSFVFLISIIGYCGEITGKQYIITAFGLTLMAAIVFELGILIYIQIKNESLKRDLPTSLNRTFVRSLSDENYRYSWDYLQSENKCCGIKTSNDWETLGSKLPSSCCQNSSTTCSKSSAYQNSCDHAFVELFKKMFALLTVVGLTLCILHLIGIVLACCLYSDYLNQNAAQREVMARQDAQIERAVMLLMSER